MIEQIKTYFVEVALKKYLPSFIKGAVAAGCLYIAGHAGLMEAIGLSFDPSDNTLTLQLTKFTAWLVAGGSGLVMAAMTAAQHHTTAVVTGKPQSGDVRVNPESVVEGGKRAGDVPKGDMQ